MMEPGGIADRLLGESMTTKREKGELQLELGKLQEWDKLVHQAMPPAGNANLEQLQVLIADNIRAVKKELG